jgi:hypothetical protein
VKDGDPERADELRSQRMTSHKLLTRRLHAEVALSQGQKPLLRLSLCHLLLCPYAREARSRRTPD